MSHASELAAQRSQAYQQLARDHAQGTIPTVNSACAACQQGVAVPFDIKPTNEDHYMDNLLGLDPNNAGMEWLFDNSWIPPERREQNFRDSFLLRVLNQLSKECSAEKMAEMYAYIMTERYQFDCIDERLHATGESVHYRLLENLFNAPRPQRGTPHEIRNNLVFHGNQILYTSYTQATHVVTQHDPLAGELYSVTTWDEIQGQFNVQAAARMFLANYERAKADTEWWKRFWGFIEAATAILSVVPIAGQFAAAARGGIAAVRAVRYTFYAIEAALSADMLVDGSSKLISGEGLSLGEELFKKIGSYVDPVNGEERGKQVFLVINMLMLAPLAGGAIKWSMARIPATRNAMVAYELAQSINRNAANIARNGEAVSIYTRMSRSGEDATRNTIRIETKITPSLDTNSWFHEISVINGRANAVIKTPTLQNHLAMMIHNAGSSLRVAGKIGHLVGDVGDEILIRFLQHRFNIPRSSILGALENNSRNGLDLIIKVPPPPDITRRVPVSGSERNSIFGSTTTTGQPRAHQMETIDLTRHPLTGAPVQEGELILVIENKTTLGLQETPGLIGSTQRQGGLENVERVLRHIDRETGGYSKVSMIRRNPSYANIVTHLKRALRQGNIHTVHSQVFLRADGSINTAVGNGSGIQFNRW